MKVVISFLISFSMCFLDVHAVEDTIPRNNLEIDFVFSFDRLLSSEDKSVHDPQNLVDHRLHRSPFSREGPTYSEYTDNPYFHFASFVGIQMDYFLVRNFLIHTDLFAEHRGYSFGFLRKDIVQFFPQFYLEGADTLTVFNQSVELQARLGDLIHHSVNHGLTFSNDDFQGGSLWLKWRKLFFRYLVFADASANSGLNIDELWSYKIGWESSVFKNTGSAVFSAYVDRITVVGSQEYPFYHYGLCGELYYKQWRIYGESTFRNTAFQNPGTDESSIQERLAFLFGAYRKWKWHNGDEVDLNFNARRYGKHFNNFYFYEGESRFRNTDESLSGNFAGKLFYPLKNTYRPFSKWPVFTQFQDSELWSAGLSGSFEKRVWRNFHVSGELETLLLYTENTGMFVYNFYHVGIGFKGWNGFELELYMTNRVMNLDVVFQTFYQSNTPFLGYRCIRWLGEGQDMEKQQRLY